MSWNDLYMEKRLTPSQAAERLSDCHNLILGMGVAMPPALITAIADAYKNDALPALNIYYMHGSATLQEQLLTPAMRGKFTPRCLFLSSYDRLAVKNNANHPWIEFVPSSFHQVGRMLTENISPDCLMVTVSPMDKHGYFSLGTNADYSATVIRKARKVIVEVNHHMPRTFGECSVHISEVEALIEADVPLTELPDAAASDVDWAIARQVAERIDNGDTLQMGVGGVPNAVLSMLEHHQNLGLHSELFSPAMVKLIKCGALNGRLKRVMQHKHVFTLALGDRAMFDFMDDNPSIVGFPASWVNNPSVIRENPNIVSVNSAIEVDITGQINAEQILGHPFSGTGGQLDFVRGAYGSKGGRSFVALHSTAKHDNLSRIVPQLTGGTVTDTRMDAHYIVTEYGNVCLKGMSIPQRVKALIGIAHPKFREELTQQAIQLGYCH
ncbi:acetyl-CoA hydrolase/transferase family protein [Oceanobacter sp. 3_MG-2023]|uniref:acetyl-CoA hydrolase/transferase family protein n=2 Tax=Gammaproteobacteria TaxID=1236 RepID=UPI002736C397|nr:acetyl-CoA hydrolase/transferase C-terminal domain-containing protein [Oceanobacter sp. 3_MG-2023]MDP2504940.1 acetyl-CoA hydrolase/transferase C-terminal domain-containing protein [Oceanobacter sp. 3_MG-2023]